MTNEDRLWRYLKANKDRPLTPRQRKRIRLHDNKLKGSDKEA